MLLKGHLGIKCHSQYIKVTVPPIVNGVSGCIVRGLETIIVSRLVLDYDGLTRIQFHPAKATPLTNMTITHHTDQCMFESLHLHE